MAICAVCNNAYQDLLPTCPKCGNQNPSIHTLAPTSSDSPEVNIPVSDVVAPRPSHSKPYLDLAMLIAAANARKGPYANFQVIRQHLYQRFYRAPTDPRITVASDAYGAFLRGLIGADYYRNPECPFQLIAQMPGNKSEAINPDQIAHIEAIRHVRKTRPNPVLSRLTLTFGGGSISEIFSKISVFHLHFPVIENFKIMGQAMFGQGPDDIVLYLNQRLNSSTVRDLASRLIRDDLLIRSLADCVPAPLCLQRCTIGVYGTDIPALSAGQAERLQIDLRTSGGSAGWLASSMATYLALYTRASSSGLPSDEDYASATSDLCRYLSLDPTNPAYST